MNLYIAHPQRTINLHFRIKEVWPTVTVVQTWVYDLYLLTVGSLQAANRPHLMFPAIVQQLFHIVRLIH